MAQYTSNTFKPLLKRLIETPEYFMPDDLKAALNHLLTPNVLEPSQIGAFLASLHVHRVWRQPVMLAATAVVMQEKAAKVEVLDAEGDFIVDIVGFGGDGHNVFNVSTTAGVVAAGAGARVIKHGNHALTSLSGSANILESLGCQFTGPTPGGATPIPRIPFYFILASNYHFAYSLLAPQFRALPFPNMFHAVGPLVNPARPRGMVLGVVEPEIGLTIAQSIRESGVERALVVCGHEKLDEISCAGPTWVWELKDGNITEMILTPEDFGLEEHPISDVAGGSGKDNAVTFERLLTAGKDIPKDLAPVLDFVLINASALLVVAGLAKDFKQGTAMALESIVSGLAWKALEQFRGLDQQSTTRE